MQNATVVVRRLLARLGLDHATRPALPTRTSLDAIEQARRTRMSAALPTRTSSRARPLVAPLGRPLPADRLGRLVATAETVVRRLRAAVDGTSGAERALPIAVAILVLGASIASVMPATGTSPDTRTAGEAAGFDPASDATPTARITIGAVAGPLDEEEAEPVAPSAGAQLQDLPAGDRAVATISGQEVEAAGPSTAPFALDATLLKPVAPETTVADGSALLKKYRVKSGDTLSGIASQFGVSTMTIVWSNGLKSKDLQVGQRLVVPPVNGAVIKVGDTDTLASIAKEFRVPAEKILAFNGLTDPNVKIGQLLVLPGGKGEMLPPDPTPAPVRITGGSGRGGKSAPSRTTTYAGGRLRWPVAGGYISQRFHYGHYGMDIAADRGTPVLAAAAGTVIFSGWYRNGGGYQVWISHGSNLYTTYNHMSSCSVSAGQQVGKGDRVGRVGSTGIATGPHLHFEVWRGRPWNGGYRVNPAGLL